MRNGVRDDVAQPVFLDHREDDKHQGVQQVRAPATTVRQRILAKQGTEPEDVQNENVARDLGAIPRVALLSVENPI
jgi:hypothetical protein